MSINKSIDHFKWKLQNTWKPTSKDVEAYNDIANYIKNTQKKQIVDNVLFTKLYIHVLGEFLTYYKATVTDTIPQKELHKILNSPMNMIIEKFKEKANNQELNLIKTTEDLENYNEITFDECVDNIKILTTEAINNYSPKHLERV